MPRELFGDVTSPSVTVGTRSRYTVPLSIAAHAVVVVGLLAVPLFTADIVPMPSAMLVFAAPAIMFFT